MNPALSHGEWLGGDYNENYCWVLDGLLGMIDMKQSNATSGHLKALSAESGSLVWEFEVDQPGLLGASQPLFCEGKAYDLLEYEDAAGESRYLFLIVDPVGMEVFGSWDLGAIRPFFIADGILLGQDYATDEIVAIGEVTPSLRDGGRARLVTNATLRGAPNEQAIDRGQLSTGTIVEILGDRDISSGEEWTSVSVAETGDGGWLPSNMLEGIDGPVQFARMDLLDFGVLRQYP